MNLRHFFAAGIALAGFGSAPVWPQTVQAAPRPGTTILQPANRPAATAGPRSANSAAPGTPLQTGATAVQGPATIAADLVGMDLYYCRGFADGRRLATGRYGSDGAATEIYIVYVTGPTSRAALSTSAVELEPGTCGIVGKHWGDTLTKVLTVKLPQPGAWDQLERLIGDFTNPQTYYEFRVIQNSPTDLQVEKFGPFSPTLARAPAPPAPCVERNPDGSCAAARQRSALVGGEAVNETEREARGLLTLRLPRKSCSASLINNKWAITAAHCIENASLAGTRYLNAIPGAVTLTPRFRGLTAVRAAAIHSFRPLDVALIELERPIPVLGSTFGFSQSVWTQSPNALKDARLALLGRGINQFAFQNFDGSGVLLSEGPSMGNDTYQKGLATYRTIESNLLWYPNEDDTTAVVAGGDSGGPSYVDGRLVGVHALCQNTCAQGKVCDGDDPWTWSVGTTACADAPVAPVWNQIRQIIADRSPPEAPEMRVENVAFGAVKYTNPTTQGEDGRRHFLDGCETWNANCGRPAANNFCSRIDRGRPTAVDHAIRQNVGASAVIEGGRICHGPGCGAFAQITCANMATYRPNATRPRQPNPSGVAVAAEQTPPDTATPARPLTPATQRALTPNGNPAVQEAASGRTPNGGGR